MDGTQRDNGDVVAAASQPGVFMGPLAPPSRLLPQTNAPAVISAGNRSSDVSSGIYPCSICPSRIYRSQAALNVHQRTIHGILDSPSHAVLCQEPSCAKVMHTVSELRSHLTKDHGLRLKQVDSEFPNMKAFTRWKEQVEQSECVCFIAKRSKNLATERQHYYYCQRSWACRNSSSIKSARLSSALTKPEVIDAPREDEPPAKVKKPDDRLDGDKVAKAGSVTAILELPLDKDKGYVHCTAQLTVREDLRTGRILVSGCLTHYAHSMTSRHFVEGIYRRSRAVRLKEGGVAGQEPVDISSVEDRLLAIYELAAAKKKQKSVDKIQAALQDLFDCLKDYDEDDETLPGLEETRAWRQSAAQEEAERERTNRCQNRTVGSCTTPSSTGGENTNSSSSRLGLAAVATQNPADPVQAHCNPTSVPQTSVTPAVSDGSPLAPISLADATEPRETVAVNVASGERNSSTDSNDGHLWAFQGEGVVVTTIAHG